jgi:hypothetical protein
MGVGPASPSAASSAGFSSTVYVSLTQVAQGNIRGSIKIILASMDIQIEDRVAAEYHHDHV